MSPRRASASRRGGRRNVYRAAKMVVLPFRLCRQRELSDNENVTRSDPSDGCTHSGDGSLDDRFAHGLGGGLHFLTRRGRFGLGCRLGFDCCWLGCRFGCRCLHTTNKQDDAPKPATHPKHRLRM